MGIEPTSEQVKEQLQGFKDIGLPVLKGNRVVLGEEHGAANKKILGRWLAQWYLQGVKNYPIVSQHKGINLLTMCAKGVPTFVIGIGPSLDQNIEDLKLVDKRAIIICTDASLRPLVAHGIKPHLVVSFDCREEQHTLFNGINTTGLILLANSCTHPNTIEAWKGSKLFFNMDHERLELTDLFLPVIYPNLGKLPNLGTVGNTAVMVAWVIGSTNIMLVGMDLCYQKTQQGEYKYRCQDYKWCFNETTKGVFGVGGWQEHENKVLYDNDLRVKDAFQVQLKGKDFMVDPELDLYRDCLARAIGRWDIPVIDCSIDGVMGQFVRGMSIKETMEDICIRSIHPGETIMTYLNQILGGS